MPSHSHNKVQKQILTQYTLHNCIIESVSSAKYLGVDISSDLSWDTHITRISKKAINTLGAYWTIGMQRLSLSTPPLSI